MDFYRINTKISKDRETKEEVLVVYPDFLVRKSNDLMVRGKSFYAVWDQESGLWSTDEYLIQDRLDGDIRRYAEEHVGDHPNVKCRLAGSFSTGIWSDFKSYISKLGDNAKQLDSKLVWANTEVNKTDYASKRLPYNLEEGSTDAWDEILDTLYNPEERMKIEWSIGAIVSGEAQKIQKFMVLYGAPGTGKSTIMNIILKLFEGYTTTFDSKALTGSNSQFSLEVFKTNPLVAVQQDGDLSRIEDNTRLNSIVSHEEMTINEKNKPLYTARINAFLYMGTNKPVKITDSKSGIIRRLIDVQPTGNLIPVSRYHALMSQVGFELGAIATRCLKVYRELGRDYYEGYKPIRMIQQTDPMYDFVDSVWDFLVSNPMVTLNQMYDMYKEYVADGNIPYPLRKTIFREELKAYFEHYSEREQVDGYSYRHIYQGFLVGKLQKSEPKQELAVSLEMEESESLFDKVGVSYPAQVANSEGLPQKRWDDVTTTLGDLDTSQIHYVLVPENHIVIDFDLKNDKGEKDMAMNLEEAAKWPATYAELSKGGGGVHLHYIYDGDVSQLASEYSPGIEIKTLLGKASLRRRLTKCNNVEIAHISSGLPTKEAPVINDHRMMTDRGLRELIERNLRKEIHPGTKPSIDFIEKVLDDAQKSGMDYDVSDMFQRVLVFATNSTNQSDICVKKVMNMKFKSETEAETEPDYEAEGETLTFFDIEVFPNLFVVCYSEEGRGYVHELVNPEPYELEPLLKKKLVGFNNRKYDNHVLYAAYLGRKGEDLKKFSDAIIKNQPGATIREAYNISWADIYDYSSKKQSLKRWQIELGLNHKELGLPWEEPVDESLWPLVVEYCKNDVVTTKQLHEALIEDYHARELLADLSGLRVNDTTQRHAAAIIFEGNHTPQSEFVYTDLSKDFPGYKFEWGKSTYLGEEVSEGGLVRAKPGMYEDVVVFDVASMHPSSIMALNLFGRYTKNFGDILQARLHIKRREFDKAREALDGKLAKYVTEEGAKKLAYSLKIIINIVYGLTAAKFDNPFRDPRNVDNIVAKRGALFMMDLRKALNERGIDVIHIKTDSIKVCSPSKETEEFIYEFGRKWGYEFEVEDKYSKFALVNDSTYIAMDHEGKWHATGAQFAEPFVFKTMFSGEEVGYDDLVQTKTVTTEMYLDMNEYLNEGEHNYVFVGKAGAFVPVMPGKGGGELLRLKDDKYYAVTGTKGYRWRAAAAVDATESLDDVDLSYFERLVDNAYQTLSKFGDVKEFLAPS